jgi:hypothetical protein
MMPGHRSENVFVSDRMLGDHINGRIGGGHLLLWKY